VCALLLVDRFIDHTLATPWETLVSDIEGALRSLSRAEAANKVDIYYYGLTYRLEKRRSTTLKKVESKTKESTRDFLWLLTTFNINWFMLLSHATNSNDYRAAYRQTVLSAFITAVKNVGGSHGLHVPTFFSFSYVTDIGKARDLVGYQLLTASPAHRGATLISPEEAKAAAQKSRWCRFESHLCADVMHKPHLTSYDGLRKVFQNQLAALRLGGANGDNYFVEAEFAYKHNHHDIYGYLQELSNRPQSLTKSAQPSAPKLLADKFVRRVAELIPPEDSTLILLTELSVVLTYRAQPHNSIIDNLNFTTYVPSKQPPHCWTAQTNFTRLPSLHAARVLTPPGHSPHHHSQPHILHSPLIPQTAYLNFGNNATALSASWMSTCVRKLMAFYLLSVYCTKRKISVETMSAEIEATEGILDRSILDRILEVRPWL
jgi:hypothetical protein